MNSGYYAACSGLMSRTQALDTIANNLANVSTAGFRASHNVFGSVLATMGNSPLSILNQDANDFGVLSGTHLDTSQGALVPTGNDLDVAIEGSGYFAVQTAAGPVYTRGGNFRVSPQGQLITAAGDPVLGDNGPISIAGTPVSISADSPSSRTDSHSRRSKSRRLSPIRGCRSATSRCPCLLTWSRPNHIRCWTSCQLSRPAIGCPASVPQLTPMSSLPAICLGHAYPSMQL